MFQNNIIVTSTPDDRFVVISVAADGSGIGNDYNLYAGPAQWTTLGMDQSFTAWRSSHSTWDQHSIVGDAMLTDTTEFNQTAATTPVYDWSKAAPRPGSPALGSGTDQSSVVTTDFTGAPRALGSYDLGALAGR